MNKGRWHWYPVPLFMPDLSVQECTEWSWHVTPLQTKPVLAVGFEATAQPKAVHVNVPRVLD